MVSFYKFDDAVETIVHLICPLSVYYKNTHLVQKVVKMVRLMIKQFSSILMCLFLGLR